MENRTPVTWVALSIGVSGVVMIGLHGGWLAVLIGQVILVVVITVYRTLSDKGSG